MLLIQEGEQWARWGGGAAEGLAEMALLCKGCIDFVTLAPFSPCLPSAPAAPGGPWGGWQDSVLAFQHNINTHSNCTTRLYRRVTDHHRPFAIIQRLTGHKEAKITQFVCMFDSFIWKWCTMMNECCINALVLSKEWSSLPQILSGYLSSLLAFQFTSIRFHIEQLSCLINGWVLSLNRNDSQMPLNVHYFSCVRIYLSDLDMPLFGCKDIRSCSHVQCVTHREHTHPFTVMPRICRPSLLSGQDLSAPQRLLSTPPPVVPLQNHSPSKFHSDLADCRLSAIDWEPIMWACLLSWSFQLLLMCTSYWWGRLLISTKSHFNWSTIYSDQSHCVGVLFFKVARTTFCWLCSIRCIRNSLLLFLIAQTR